MSDEITFYFNPRSRAVMVHWMLEEVGAPYRIVRLDFEKGENRKPAFLAVNPMGKLPTISWRGTVVTETAAIIAFLADSFPAAGLAPALDDPKRGTYYRWLFFGAGCLEPALIDRMFQRPEPRKSALGYGSYDDVVQVMRQTLGAAPYLLGDRFSAADLYVGSEIFWGRLTGAREFEGGVFDDYLARLAARPAYKNSIEKDFGG